MVVANKYFYSLEKRVFDVVLSVLGLCISAPIFIIIIPLILLFNGRPIIFKQKRYGKDKKIFTIYKIRTMKHGSSLIQKKLKSHNEAPYPMFKMKNDPRFEKFGKILSKFGLDEVPQLFNILKGEMSLVGPRPLPIKEAKKLPNSWKFRYSVKPGIVSFWAISPKRHQSLKTWRELEIITLKIESVKEDFFLVLRSIHQVVLARIIKVVPHHKDNFG